MLMKKSNPSDIEYHIEQMKVLLMSQAEEEILEQVLRLESFVENKNITSFIGKELGDESWNYDTQALLNSCKKKREKDLIIKNHIKECYHFMIFRYLEEKISNFPEIVVSKEGNHKSYKWIFTCHSRHEGDEPVRWANMKLNKAMELSNIKALFEMMQDDREQVIINEKWLISNSQSFYSSDIFEDTNTIIRRKENEKMNAQLVTVMPTVTEVANLTPIDTQLNGYDPEDDNYIPEDDSHSENDVMYL